MLQTEKNMYGILVSKYFGKVLLEDQEKLGKYQVESYGERF
jgi:hypothetical protein